MNLSDVFDCFDIFEVIYAFFTKRRRAFRFACAAFVLTAVMILACLWPAAAAVRYSGIEEVPGLRFENLVYAWDKVELDVVNTTSAQKEFWATMIFLDRRGKTLARASLLPKKIAARRAERYTAYFAEGSGDSAQKAERIVWDLGVQ